MIAQTGDFACGQAFLTARTVVPFGWGVMPQDADDEIPPLEPEEMGEVKAPTACAQRMLWAIASEKVL